ncbi:MAG: VOC family protein [Hydrogenophilaceae bacterium]|jgi:catechol 2,3-dioxygenase-like lactoylglutathione lyase family enzyme|nr:VOC family protein [Hydrogenophilaceae bacterium]
MAIEINGVAHTFITAGDYQRSRAFYRRLLPFLGLQPVLDSDAIYYCIGGRTGFGVEAPSPQYAGERFVQSRVGLHHHCFRARSRADVDAVHALLASIGATIVHPPQEDGYAPGYYSLLFEDPDGVRLEINHVPGRGLLAEDGVARPVGSAA